MPGKCTCIYLIDTCPGRHRAPWSRQHAPGDHPAWRSGRDRYSLALSQPGALAPRRVGPRDVTGRPSGAGRRSCGAPWVAGRDANAESARNRRHEMRSVGIRGDGNPSRTRNRPHSNDTPARHQPANNVKPLGGRTLSPGRQPTPVDSQDHLGAVAPSALLDAPATDAPVAEPISTPGDGGGDGSTSGFPEPTGPGRPGERGLAAGRAGAGAARPRRSG